MKLNLRALGQSVNRTGGYLGQTLRLMVGVPDYDSYLDHMGRTHPDQTPMTYAEFFENRQNARYSGRGRVGCC